MTQDFNQLVFLFNSNLSYIRKQMNFTTYKEMVSKYSAESDSHLAKILSLRGIKLFA